MQGNAPDEERTDPHGECRHEIETLRLALARVRDVSYDPNQVVAIVDAAIGPAPRRSFCGGI